MPAIGPAYTRPCRGSKLVCRNVPPSKDRRECPGCSGSDSGTMTLRAPAMRQNSTVPMESPSGIPHARTSTTSMRPTRSGEERRKSMRPSRPSHSRGRKLMHRVTAFPRTALLLASILLAVVLGSRRPGHAQPADLRTVTLRVAADDAYRAQPNWEANLRATVATGSATLYGTLQILS